MLYFIRSQAGLNGEADKMLRLYYSYIAESEIMYHLKATVTFCLSSSFQSRKLKLLPHTEGGW